MPWSDSDSPSSSVAARISPIERLFPADIIDSSFRNFSSKQFWVVNYMFIHQVALAKSQRRDLSIFESSCHLPTCLPHTVEASHCPFARPKAGALWVPIFIAFGKTRLGIKPECTVWVVDSLSIDHWSTTVLMTQRLEVYPARKAWNNLNWHIENIKKCSNFPSLLSWETIQKKTSSRICSTNRQKTSKGCLSFFLSFHFFHLGSS